MNNNKTHKHTNYSYRHSKINMKENLWKLYHVWLLFVVKKIA